MSLPTGERGLKYFKHSFIFIIRLSLPTGERGLKSIFETIAENI